MKTLILNDAEQAVFSKLSADLRKDCKVQPETIVFQDTQEARDLRLEMMEITDPAVLHFQRQISEIQSPEQFNALVNGIDLGSISDAAINQLLFALGPDAITILIGRILPNVKSREDVQGIADLSEVRHSLLHSLTVSIPTV